MLHTTTYEVSGRCKTLLNKEKGPAVIHVSNEAEYHHLNPAQEINALAATIGNISRNTTMAGRNSKFQKLSEIRNG